MTDSRTYGRNFKAELFICKTCKYEATNEELENSTRAIYEVSSWDIVTGDDATQIGLTTDEASRDEYNEYLVLHLTDGDTATFRNSHVDMFRIGWA